jgi:hypothetical protein
VTLRVTARKFQTDGTGAEREAPMDDYLDVGVLDASGRALMLERKRIGAQPTEFTFVVDREPARAGIDPFHLFIDRSPSDNTAVIRLIGGPGRLASAVRCPHGPHADGDRSDRGRMNGQAAADTRGLPSARRFGYTW